MRTAATGGIRPRSGGIEGAKRLGSSVTITWVFQRGRKIGVGCLRGVREDDHRKGGVNLTRAGTAFGQDVRRAAEARN